MLLLMKINELFHPIHIGLFGSQAIVKVTDVFPQLIQQPSRLENRRAGFSGAVMTVHKYSISPASHIASGLVGFFASDVRETKAVMGGQKPVALY
jgi:hypothetical protein